MFSLMSSDGRPKPPRHGLREVHHPGSRHLICHGAQLVQLLRVAGRDAEAEVVDLVADALKIRRTSTRIGRFQPRSLCFSSVSGLFGIKMTKLCQV